MCLNFINLSKIIYGRNTIDGRQSQVSKNYVQTEINFTILCVCFLPLFLFHSSFSFFVCHFNAFFSLKCCIFKFTTHCVLNTQKVCVCFFCIKYKNHMKTWKIDRNSKLYTKKKTQMKYFKWREEKKRKSCTVAYIQKTVCRFWDA